MQGYDPDKYLEMYENAEGSTPQEKINAMRRAHYAENAPTIRAQKRAAYAARREREKELHGDAGRGKIQETETMSLSSHNMHNSSDVLYERVGHVPPIPGYDDVFLHGDAWGVATRNADGREVSIPNTEFIKALKSLDLENNAIRLCVCSAGAEDRGLACLAAREMDMPVMAATTDIWVGIPDKQGVSTMELYANNGKNRPDVSKPGRWRIFYPDGRIEDV